jgi:hypothetical protein
MKLIVAALIGQHVAFILIATICSLRGKDKNKDDLYEARSNVVFTSLTAPSTQHVLHCQELFPGFGKERQDLLVGSGRVPHGTAM